MSTSTTLFAALEDLNQMVSGIENAIAKFDARPKGGKRRENQMDLFSGPVAAASFDSGDATRRIDRAIAQIETVLGRGA